MSYLGVGVSPGNVPVYHMTDSRIVDRRVRVAELVLRCLISALGLVVCVLVATDTQIKEIFSIQKKAKFTDMKALVFLVMANGIVAAYSLVQALRCGVSMVRGNVLSSKPLAWVIFSGDQDKVSRKRKLAELGRYGLSFIAITMALPCLNLLISSFNKVMAYVTVAAVGAAAQSAVFAKLGQAELQWMKICNMYDKFCNQAGVGIASALLVSLSMVVISGISAFNLFRLCGGNKAKSGARW